MQVGDTIRQLLERNGLSQADLARGLARTPFYVHNLLKKESADSAVLEKVAKFLGVPITVFFDGAQDDETKKKPILVSQKKCKVCHEKDVLIESLKETITSQKKVIKLLEQKEGVQ